MTTAAMDAEVNVRERVLKPASEVFAAIIDPAKMKLLLHIAPAGR